MPSEVKHLPVAVIGKDWSLLWASQDTLSEIVGRTGIKIGTLLYADLPSQPDAYLPSAMVTTATDAWNVWWKSVSTGENGKPMQTAFDAGFIAALRAMQPRQAVKGPDHDQG